MIVLADYHVHTDNSFDSKTTMIEMCERAVKIGLREVAFTDHFNNHLLDIDLGFYDPKRYFDDIEYCQAQFPQLTILAGIEIGEPHRWQRKIRPVLANYPYDIVLGSLHWVGNENLFNETYFRARQPLRAYQDYFVELRRMVEHGGFDVLAHADLPKRLGYEIYGPFDLRHCEKEIRAVWQACIDRNITVEINTKGLRIPVKEFHPSPETLRWYIEMGGKYLTLGSDAHHPASLGQGIELARQSALDAGLKRLCRYSRRQVVGWDALA